MILSFSITYQDRHDPVYPVEHLQELLEQGETEQVLRLAEFHKAYPTKRHWHHHVHSAFGVPCDDICKPSRTYTGQSLIEKVNAAYRIEDIAARHTNLRGTHTLSGPCFLHAGSGSEFVVWVDEQRWKCFGRCGIGGDALDLIRACKEGGFDWHG